MENPKGLSVFLRYAESPGNLSSGTRRDACPGRLVLSAEHEPVLTRSYEHVVENRHGVCPSFGRRRVGFGRSYESEGVFRAVGWLGRRSSGGVARTMK
jgi:hypothetical protein